MLEKLSKKNKNIIFIIGLAGIVLIFLSSFISCDDSNKNKNKNNTSSQSTGNVISSEEYTKQLENSLTDLIANIEGVGNTKVMVTLENGIQTEYATEEKVNSEASKDKNSGQTQTSYITVKDSDGTEHALAITEYAPKIRGVVVVCTGGNQSIVQQRVTTAVSTALNVASNRVCVTKLS